MRNINTGAGEVSKHTFQDTTKCGHAFNCLQKEFDSIVEEV